MDRIVLPVDEKAGKIYRQLSTEKQMQIAEALSIALKKSANDATAIEYQKLLDEFGSQAVANGLTSEILADLLKRGE